MLEFRKDYQILIINGKDLNQILYKEPLLYGFMCKIHETLLIKKQFF